MKNSFTNKIILTLFLFFLPFIIYTRVDGLPTIANIMYERPNVFNIVGFIIVLLIIIYFVYDDFKSLSSLK